MAKKVLKYTEEEFVTLLENIVKRVKKEERINESRKRVEKSRRLSESKRPKKNIGHWHTLLHQTLVYSQSARCTRSTWALDCLFVVEKEKEILIHLHSAPPISRRRISALVPCEEWTSRRRNFQITAFPLLT